MLHPKRESETLDAGLDARDYQAIDKLLASGIAVSDDKVEDIARVLMEVPFGHLTVTSGWWTLAKRLLPRSLTLRQHMFGILRGNSGEPSADPAENVDRSNLLAAIGPLKLTADELYVLRQLRDRLTPRVYQEDVDAVLFEYMTTEDQMAALMKYWVQAESPEANPIATATAQINPNSAAALAEEMHWRRSPFRLLACMPFRLPTVSRAWFERLRPAFENLGEVLRLDWSTDDWVRDVRRLADDASYVLIDLTAANANVRRELGHLLRREIPFLCYADGTNALSTVGQVHPTLTQDAESINAEVWGLPVYTADYDSPRDLDRLVSRVDAKIRPFRDVEDPTAAYVGRDLFALSGVERQGFEIARIPRARTSAERLLRVSEELIAESAIFRARVFAWLRDPHLQIHSAENLWLREHLLMMVLADMRRGNRLTSVEAEALQVAVNAESVEALRDLGEEALASAPDALTPSQAEQRGLPPIPRELSGLLRAGPLPGRLRVEFTAEGEPVGLRASAWPVTFGERAISLRKAMLGESGQVSRQRIFDLKATGPAEASLSSFLGEVGDALDALAEDLGALTPELARRWPNSDIETFLQATVTLAVIRELRRRQLFNIGRGEQEHTRLASELAYIWGRTSSDFKLFEFAAKSQPVHFRGLLPWMDIKEQAVRVYAREAARLLEGNISEEDILKQAMAWDILPAQLWDAVLLSRMPQIVPVSVMRGIWARYVLPSAFLYWRRELIYADPADTGRWAYV